MTVGMVIPESVSVLELLGFKCGGLVSTGVSTIRYRLTMADNAKGIILSPKMANGTEGFTLYSIYIDIFGQMTSNSNVLPEVTSVNIAQEVTNVFEQINSSEKID